MRGGDRRGRRGGQPRARRARGRAAPRGRSGADALQCRRARMRGLRDRARRASRRLGDGPAGLRCGSARPAGAPGRAAHGVGARPARASRTGSWSTPPPALCSPPVRSTRSSSAPTGSRRTATWPTRSAPTRSPCSRTRTACRSRRRAGQHDRSCDRRGRRRSRSSCALADEVRGSPGGGSHPPGAAAHNPAFDVTPARLVTAIVSEGGVWRPEPGAARRASSCGERPRGGYPAAVCALGGRVPSPDRRGGRAAAVSGREAGIPPSSEPEQIRRSLPARYGAGVRRGAPRPVPGRVSGLRSPRRSRLRRLPAHARGAPAAVRPPGLDSLDVAFAYTGTARARRRGRSTGVTGPRSPGSRRCSCGALSAARSTSTS